MASSKNYWLDANIILRYVTNDSKEFSPIATKLIYQFVELKSKGYINTLVLDEIIYVLENVYKFSRTKIETTMSNFISISGIKIIDLDKDLVKKAMISYKNKNVDFPDCIYSEICKHSGYDPLTFDEDFKKLGYKSLIKK